MPISVTTGDPVARANTAADLKYNAQQDAVKRAIAQLGISSKANEAAINQYGASGRGAIGDTFGQLFGNLATNRQLTAADLGTQVNQIGQGYRDASAVGQAAADQGVEVLRQLAGNNPNYSPDMVAQAANPIVALAARQIANNANSDATTTGNLKNWAAQQDAILRAGEAGAQRDKSNRLSAFETDLMNQLAGNKNNALTQEGDLQSKLLALLNERGAYTADAAANFADTAFGQQLQAAGYNLDEANAVRQAQQAQAQLAMQAAAQQQSASENAWKQAMAERQYNDNKGQDSAAAAQQAFENELKLKALGIDTAKFAADQNARQQQTALSVGSLLNDAYGGGTDAQILAYLQSQGLIPSAASGPGVGASGAGTGSSGASGVTGGGYGSRVTSKAASNLNANKVPIVSGNMGSWTGIR